MKIIKNLFRKFGFFTPKDSLRVYWWSGEGNRNFGDIISPYIVKKISGKDSILVNRYCLKNNYLVTGSILAMANKNSIIWGSLGWIFGFTYGIFHPREGILEEK